MGVAIGAGIKLSSLDCPTTEEEKAEMEDTPYANAVGSLMYAMVSTRPDLAYPMSVLSTFLSNPGHTH